MGGGSNGIFLKDVCMITIRVFIAALFVAIIFFAARDIVTAKAAGKVEMRKCPTTLQLFNPYDHVILYRIVWFDHGIKEYLAENMDRCGGELKPFQRYSLPPDFRLCPGKHMVTWFIGKERVMMRFTVFDKEELVLLSPNIILRHERS